MSYSSPANPYANVPLQPGYTNGQAGAMPQTYGNPGTGYQQNVGAPAVNAANLMPPDSLDNPGQNANLAESRELDRQSEMVQLATTRTQMLSMRLEAMNSIRQQMQNTVMGIDTQDLDYSNEVIAFGDKAVKGAQKDEQGS